MVKGTHIPFVIITPSVIVSLGFLTEKLKIKPQQLGQPGQKQA